MTAQPHICIGGALHWRSFPCVPGDSTHLANTYHGPAMGDLYESRTIHIGYSAFELWQEADCIYFLVLEGMNALDTDSMIREWMQFIGREQVKWLSKNDPRTAHYG
jgi:hypothetical protein